MLATQPEVPAPGKWTKLGSVLTFLLMGAHCGGLLEKAYKASMESMPIQTAVDKSDDQEQDIDPALNSSLHWSAVHGKRARNGLALTGLPEVRFRVLVLAVLQEVTRFLTNFHLNAHGRQSRGSTQAPPLLDVVNDEFSPYIMLLQFLSSLLINLSGRVLLVCPGFKRVCNWESHRLEEVRVFRRMIMLCSAWIYRRHILFAREPPFSTCVTR